MTLTADLLPQALKAALVPGPAPVPMAHAAVGGGALLELATEKGVEEALGLSTNGVRIRLGRHSLWGLGERFLRGEDVPVSWIVQTTDPDPAGREGTMGQGHGIVACGECPPPEYLEMLKEVGAPAC